MEKVKIYGTGKFIHMPEGTEYLEPKDMAEVLVEMGAATYEVKEKVQATHISKAEGEPTAKKNRKGK